MIAEIDNLLLHAEGMLHFTVVGEDERTFRQTKNAKNDVMGKIGLKIVQLLSAGMGEIVKFQLNARLKSF